jgi:hypothetical protein
MQFIFVSYTSIKLKKIFKTLCADTYLYLNYFVFAPEVRDTGFCTLVLPNSCHHSGHAPITPRTIQILLFL